MEPDKPQPPAMPIGDAILTIVIGGLLTYFFFEPISEFVQSLLRSAL